MDGWENTVWFEKARHKPHRCYVRDEIEEIIKEKNIDRTRFHEFSKFRYQDIIRKFYYNFADYKNFTPSRIHLDFTYMHLRDNLEIHYIDCFFRTDNWVEYMETVRAEISHITEKMYLIVAEGWVYEGYVNEIFDVLIETDCGITDCYIVSSKFDWFIAVSEIEDNAVMYRKR